MCESHALFGTPFKSQQNYTVDLSQASRQQQLPGIVNNMSRHTRRHLHKPEENAKSNDDGIASVDTHVALRNHLSMPVIDKSWLTFCPAAGKTR